MGCLQAGSAQREGDPWCDGEQDIKAWQDPPAPPGPQHLLPVGKGWVPDDALLDAVFKPKSLGVPLV